MTPTAWLCLRCGGPLRQQQHSHRTSNIWHCDSCHARYSTETLELKGEEKRMGVLWQNIPDHNAQPVGEISSDEILPLMEEECTSFAEGANLPSLKES